MIIDVTLQCSLPGEDNNPIEMTLVEAEQFIDDLEVEDIDNFLVEEKLEFIKCYHSDNLELNYREKLEVLLDTIAS